MSNDSKNEALDLIHSIAVSALGQCEEPIPNILEEALDEIAALSRYKGEHGNPMSEERKRMFDIK